MKRTLIVALLLTACSTEPAPTAVAPIIPTVQVQTVESGLKRSFTVTGEVEAAKQATVGADTKADVIQLLVQIGDEVQKGELLMVLGSDNVNTRITNANISYGTAVQNVEQTKITSQVAVENAEITLETAEKNLQTTLQEISTRKTQAQEAYQSSLISQSLSVDAAQTTVQNALSTTKSTVSTALSIANTVFEFNDDINDGTNVREIHIGITNPTFRRDNNQLLEGLFERSRYVPDSYENALELLQLTERAFKQSIDVLNNSIVSSAYPQAQLTSDIASISGQLNAVQSVLSQLRTAQANVATAQQSAGTDSQVERNAKAQLDSTLAQLESQELQARRSIEQAKNTLATAKAQASAAGINATSTLNNIGNELRSAQTAINELRINAPFAGRIKNVPVTGGEQVNAGQALLTVENTDTLKITTNIAPSDVRLLSIGSPVTINSSIKSQITNISPSADPITQKYAVEIALTNKDLQAGEFVDVQFESTISTDSRRLFVPISSVHIESVQTYIWVVRNANEGSTVASKQVVKIGNLQGRYIEVLEGLQAGSTIIINGGRTLQGTNPTVKIES